MKKVFVTLLFGGLLTVSYGQVQITRSEAVKAAVNMIRMNNPDKAVLSEDSVDSVFTMERNGNTLLYEVIFSSGERVLLSGHRGCQPVLGFFDTDTITLPHFSVVSGNEEIPDGLQILVGEYATQIEYCFQNSVSALYGEQWDSLQQISNRERAITIAIPHLVTTKWGQQSSNDTLNPDWFAYNSCLDTNPNSSCLRCCAGCGAVAIAQILKYWDSPYNIPYKCIQYSWTIMPDELIKNGNPNYTYQRDAVCALIKDCGEISNTTYCSGFGNDPCASSNGIYDSRKGFRKYGFVNADVIIRGNDGVAWTNMIFQELYNNRPVYYQACTTSAGKGGHAFICDGYYKDVSNTEYFFFNWGWNGNFNNYLLTLSNLAPPGYAFNYLHKAIVNISPSNCFPNIIMECDKYFATGSDNSYSAVDSFQNNQHLFRLRVGSNMQVQAGKDILLTDGFYAAEGSDFYAAIASCGSASLATSPDILTDNEGADNSTDTLSAPKSWQTEVTQSGDAALSVYPNPTDDLLYVELSGAGIATVALYDLQGRMVYSQNPSNSPTEHSPTATVNMRNIPAGVYVLHVTDGEGKEYRQKVVRR